MYIHGAVVLPYFVGEGGGGGGVRLKLDVKAQGGLKILEIRQFPWMSYVYRPLGAVLLKCLYDSHYKFC